MSKTAAFLRPSTPSEAKMRPDIDAVEAADVPPPQNPPPNWNIPPDEVAPATDSAIESSLSDEMVFFSFLPLRHFVYQNYHYLVHLCAAQHPRRSETYDGCDKRATG